MGGAIFAVEYIRHRNASNPPDCDDEEHPKKQPLPYKDTEQDQNDAASNGRKTAKPLTFLPDPVVCQAPLGTKTIESIDTCLWHIVSEDDKQCADQNRTDRVCLRDVDAGNGCCAAVTIGNPFFHEEDIHANKVQRRENTACKQE